MFTCQTLERFLASSIHRASKHVSRLATQPSLRIKASLPQLCHKQAPPHTLTIHRPCRPQFPDASNALLLLCHKQATLNLHSLLDKTFPDRSDSLAMPWTSPCKSNSQGCLNRSAALLPKILAWSTVTPTRLYITTPFCTSPSGLISALAVAGPTRPRRPPL